MKILFVDDTKSATDVASVYFSKSEFNLDTASNALDALDMIGTDNYDVVITDIMMHPHDGEYLAKEIKKKNPEMRVIFATNNWSEAEARKLDFIPKPLKPENVRTFLGHNDDNVLEYSKARFR